MIDLIMKEFKELFDKQNKDALMKIDVPSDKLLKCAAEMVGCLKEKGQEVEIQISASGLYITASPAGIGLIVEVEYDGTHSVENMRVWFEPETHVNREAQHVWTGEFSSHFHKVLGYKDATILLGNLAQFNPRAYVEKLLKISARFFESFPKIEQLLEKFHEDRDGLYNEFYKATKQALA